MLKIVSSFAGAKYLERVLAKDVDDFKSASDVDMQSTSDDRFRNNSSRGGDTFLSAEQRTEMDLSFGGNCRAAILTAVSARYYVLSACSALFRYIEAFESRILFSQSIRVRWTALEGTLSIDFETARALELTENSGNKKSNASLFGVLTQEYKCTPMTRRLLRTNLLAPLLNTGILDSRLDSVEELLQDDERRSALDKALKVLKSDELDIDHLAHQMLSQKGTANGEVAPNPSTTDRKISLILKIKAWLVALETGE